MELLKQCEYCGDEFEAIRDNAKYCCDSHRSLANRKRRRNEELEYERERQQEEYDDMCRIRDEEQRKREEQALAQQAEQNLIKEAERKTCDEQHRKDDEQRRIKQNEKRKKESEKRLQKAEMNFKLKVLGGVALFGIVNHFFNSREDLHKDEKKAEKPSEPSYNVLKFIEKPIPKSQILSVDYIDYMQSLIEDDIDSVELTKKMSEAFNQMEEKEKTLLKLILENVPNVKIAEIPSINQRSIPKLKQNSINKLKAVFEEIEKKNHILKKLHEMKCLNSF